MPAPSATGTTPVKIDPGAEYPTIGSCADGHDVSMTFTGAELIAINNGDTVDGFRFARKDGNIYGKCSDAGCNATLRVGYPQVDTEIVLDGWRKCSVCKGALERSGVIDRAVRASSGRFPSAFCWCGEKPENIPAVW